MDPEDAKIEDLDSSTDLDTDASAAAQAADEQAGSSPADEDGDNTDDLLNVIRDAVPQSQGDDSEGQAAAEGETTDADGDQQAGEDNEEFGDVPFHKHPRFKQLIAQRDSMKADATRYQNVQGFLDQNNLSAEETAEGLQIMALLKSNPAAAWQKLKPTVQKLLVLSGELLPDDLKQRVQAGQIDQQAALEVSRLRATQQSQVLEQRHNAAAAQRREHVQAQTAVSEAATSWENDRRVKDPNFDAKYEQLMDKVFALQRREGVPNTPEGVTGQLNKAYSQISVKAPQTAPRATQAAPSSTSSRGSSSTQPAINSTLDIIRANRKRS